MSVPLFGSGEMLPPIDPVLELKRIKQFLRQTPPCLQFNQFTIISPLNHSRESYVVKAEDKDSGEEYVLKKVKYLMNSLFGYPRNSLLESTILMQLKHENVITMEGLAVEQSFFKNYLVLEFCKEDLTQFLRNYSGLDQSEIKCILQMLLKGLEYLYNNLIIHRDISPDNLFIHASGMLKIGDFGKARYCEKNNIDEIDSELCDHNIGTPGYRAPELILNYSLYSRPVDMWSFGCIFGELLNYKPVFGKNKYEDSQMNDIIKLCSAPSAEYIKQFPTHFLFKSHVLSEQKEDKFDEVFESVCIEGIQLLRKCLVYDWNARIIPENCIQDKYFDIEPKALCPEKLLSHLCRKRIVQDNPNAVNLGYARSELIFRPAIEDSGNISSMNVQKFPAVVVNQSEKSLVDGDDDILLSEGEVPDSSGE